MIPNRGLNSFYLFQFSSFQNITLFVALDLKNQTNATYNYRLCMMIPNLSNGSVKPQNNNDDSLNIVYLAAKSVNANLTVLRTRLSSINTLLSTNEIYQPYTNISIIPESNQTIKSIELLNYSLDKFNQTELDIIAIAVEKHLKIHSQYRLK
jgi:hypothetical protein